MVRKHSFAKAAEIAFPQLALNLEGEADYPSTRIDGKLKIASNWIEYNVICGTLEVLFACVLCAFWTG